MRYFVTGATGFIGRVLVRQLREAGHEVVALVRAPSRAPNLDAELRRGDVTDRASVREAMAGAEGVFHTAGWYKVGVRDKREGYRVNVEGTRNVLSTMRDLAIPKGVYTSTIAVFSDTHGREVDEDHRYDGPHLSEYDRTKWLAHYEVADPLIRAGLPLVIVQPGVVYGPGDNSTLGTAMRQYLAQGYGLVPRRTAYCWAHVEDVARGHVLAMERGRPGESYILAGPRHTFAEGVAQMARAAGKPVRQIPLPVGLGRAMARLLAPLGSFLPDTIHPESMRVAAGTTYVASNAKARGELGWEPRSLEQGFRETFGR